MNIGATHMLELAEASDHGRLYNLISSITFSVFTLEAYFNHLGEHLYDDWSKTERKTSKIKKYTQFCTKFDITFNFNQRPYSTIKKAFSFRDTIAHGKTVTKKINKKIEVETGNLNNFSGGFNGFEFATIENGKIVLCDMQKVIKELHSAAGFKRDPFNSVSSCFAINSAVNT